MPFARASLTDFLADTCTGSIGNKQVFSIIAIDGFSKRTSFSRIFLIFGLQLLVMLFMLGRIKIERSNNILLSCPGFCRL